MPSEFPVEHRAQFHELLRTGELHATNRSDELLDFGPWWVEAHQGDPDSSTRLKSRFRAAVRKAAIAAGAPHRINLQDWWISRLARGEEHFRIEGLIQRSIELCEELESEAIESRPTPAESAWQPGLRRDRYRVGFLEPFWLYDEPHEPHANPNVEYEFWKHHVMQGFDFGITQLADRALIRRRWVDGDGVQQCIDKKILRRVLTDRIADKSHVFGLLVHGLAYDLTVLQANYVIDRKLQLDNASRAFDEEFRVVKQELELAARKGARTLGLSWRKLERTLAGAAASKPFTDVASDLRNFLMPEPVPEASPDSDEETAFTAPISGKNGNAAPNRSQDPDGEIRQGPTHIVLHPKPAQLARLFSPDGRKAIVYQVGHDEDTPIGQLLVENDPTAVRAAKRSSWMDKRHPGWSLNRWRDHAKDAKTTLAYETLRRYRAGITTTQTPGVRADLARVEKVAFSEVPE
jgi:hypothetical protein